MAVFRFRLALGNGDLQKSPKPLHQLSYLFHVAGY